MQDASSGPTSEFSPQMGTSIYMFINSWWHEQNHTLVSEWQGTDLVMLCLMKGICVSHQVLPPQSYPYSHGKVRVLLDLIKPSSESMWVSLHFDVGFSDGHSVRLRDKNCLFLHNLWYFTLRVNFFLKEKTTKVIFTIVKVYMCWLLKSLIQLQWIYAFACCQYLSGYTGYNENSFSF